MVPTPFKPIPVMGTNLTFSNLSVTFIVDEFLENYRELHDWLTAIGFPKSRKQFRDFLYIDDLVNGIVKTLKKKN